MFPVVCQLLHDMTVHIALQDLVLTGTLKYLLGQLVAGLGPPGGQVAHVLKSVVEA